MMKKIDTHLHLLYPERLSYPWVAEAPPLQARFPVEDYLEAAGGCGIGGALFMEVDVDPRHIADEVSLVRELAAKPENGIVGVIAACRPENEDFGPLLDAVDGPDLKGVRRVLHTQPDELSGSSRFRANVGTLAERGLCFDLCVLGRQLPVGIELVDACPGVTFVLDHCGVPDIAGGAFDDWARHLAALAERENVNCKISGLPTYCPPGGSGAEALRPWVEKVVELFGWDRLVWGGDWPVCTLNGSLPNWTNDLETILEGESASNLEKLYEANARRIYGIDASF